MSDLFGVNKGKPKIKTKRDHRLASPNSHIPYLAVGLGEGGGIAVHAIKIPLASGLF